MLAFTNSDATANALRRLGLAESAVAWSDPLHMGRVPMQWDPDAFGAERAAVYAEFGWDEDGVAEQDFQLRHESLRQAGASDEPVQLVFGPGLRDQLQLSQIVAWLSVATPGLAARLRLALAEAATEDLDDGQLAETWRRAREATFEEIEAYRSCWLAFVSADPCYLEAFFRRSAKSGATPLLADALHRLLREYPCAESGLSLSEGQILDAVRLGVTAPRDLYAVCQETEAYPFLSDWDFWLYLERLAEGPCPALRVEGGQGFLCPPKALAWEAFDAQRLQLTEEGLAALRGERGWQGPGSRWIGGVRVDGRNRWLWDYESGSLIRGERHHLQLA